MSLARLLIEMDADSDAKDEIFAGVYGPQNLAKMHQVRKVFRRKGDNLSTRDFLERHKLVDKTEFSIHASIMVDQGKEPYWAVFLNAQDTKGHGASHWVNHLQAAEARRIINRARAMRGKLATLPYKQRERVLKAMTR